MSMQHACEGHVTGRGRPAEQAQGGGVVSETYTAGIQLFTSLLL